MTLQEICSQPEVGLGHRIRRKAWIKDSTMFFASNGQPMMDEGWRSLVLPRQYSITLADCKAYDWEMVKE